jgi:hypothetical protein
MMLIACGMALLGKLVLSANNVIGNAEVDTLESEAINTATAIGQGMIERIVVKGYDHNFFGGKDTVATAFASTLGRDGVGEVAGKDTTFNDVDDYKGFQDSVATPRIGKFYVTCSVCYVNETSPFDSTATRTFMKRVTVSVTSNFLVDPSDPRKLNAAITLSKLIAYR